MASRGLVSTRCNWVKIGLISLLFVGQEFCLVSILGVYVGVG